MAKKFAYLEPLVCYKFCKMLKHLTFIFGFSIIALKPKKDGSGFVILPGVQKNKLCTLTMKVEMDHHFKARFVSLSNV